MRTRAATPGFTILELLVVITIIIVLAGLILSTVGYVQKKGARSRAEAEIAAMSAALESYKADNGIYPRGNAANPGTGTPPFDTDSLDARHDGSAGNPYQKATRYLYAALSADVNYNGTIDGTEAQTKAYFAFKPQMLGGVRDTNGNLTSVTFIRDPFGNSYGYSTAYQFDVEQGTNPPAKGYNPTFDLWSTGGNTSANDPPDQTQWIKNW